MLKRPVLTFIWMNSASILKFSSRLSDASVLILFRLSLNVDCALPLQILFILIHALVQQNIQNIIETEWKYSEYSEQI